jgi:predicted DNA-binding transcriptional regulator AlpA
MDTTTTGNPGVALTERDLADVLKVSTATLRAWRYLGKGPRFVRYGRIVRYLQSDVDMFIRENIVDTGADRRLRLAHAADIQAA